MLPGIISFNLALNGCSFLVVIIAYIYSFIRDRSVFHPHRKLCNGTENVIGLLAKSSSLPFLALSTSKFGLSSFNVSYPILWTETKSFDKLTQPVIRITIPGAGIEGLKPEKQREAKWFLSPSSHHNHPVISSHPLFSYPYNFVCFPFDWNIEQDAKNWYGTQKRVDIKFIRLVH